MNTLLISFVNTILRRNWLLQGSYLHNTRIWIWIIVNIQKHQNLMKFSNFPLFPPITLRSPPWDVRLREHELMRDKHRAIIINSLAIITHQRKVESNLIWKEIWKNPLYFYFLFWCLLQLPKKYRIQSENIIICCEFDAKMHLDAQNIKQFWYRASVLELLITHIHLTTHGYTNSSTHIWYPEHWRSSHGRDFTTYIKISFC